MWLSHIYFMSTGLYRTCSLSKNLEVLRSLFAVQRGVKISSLTQWATSTVAAMPLARLILEALIA